MSIWATPAASPIVRMMSVVAALALTSLAASAGPALAQESSEPPPPKSAPVIRVTEESLPRAGGIMVFGGTRGAGLDVVKALIARNEKVTVLVRASSDTAALKALDVSIVTGDALDPESLKRAFTTAPFRAAISLLGGHDGDYRVDAEGNKNVVAATKGSGVPRLILVTAVGAGDSAEDAPWVVRYFLKDYYAAKTVAEAYLRTSDLDYTIIRPGLLLDSAKSGEAALIAGKVSFGGITRADLGKLVAGVIEDQASFKKVFTAHDAKRGGLWTILTY